jgi:hypothetical protein
MKRIVYILSFYILLSTLVPCSFFDNCEEEYSEQASSSFPENDCNDCSPFSICSIGYGLAINAQTVLADPFIVFASTIYREIIYSTGSSYYFTHFQPPRTAKPILI